MKFRRETNGDIAYVRKRHELIPQAQTLVLNHFHGKKKVTREMRDYQFHRYMTVLAIKEGIISSGNLVIFDAKVLPKLGNPEYL